MRAPRCLMVVTNGVRGDSRVLKAAWSLADAGWDVLVLGASTHPDGDRFTVGRARVRVVPYRPARVKDPGLGLRIVYKLAYLHYRLRERLHLPTPTLLYNVAPMAAAMAPVAVEFAPDAIHVHDYTAAPLSNRLLESLAQAGLPAPAVVYDAHEYLPGLGHLRARISAEYSEHEQRCVAGAAAVISVSGGMSELLVERFSLSDLPPVVGNDAVTTSRDMPERTVRDDCGVGPEAFLMVYAGALAPQRGLDTVVDALPRLPGAHVAVMAPDGNRFVEPLRQRARALGVADRVHLLGYVPNNVLIGYLGAADAGLIPLLHRPNHEISLITKFGEYMHAGLPILCSDVRTMAAEVTRIGNGEVFRAGDVDDFVAAVERMRADIQRYRDALTDEAMHERTWEHQAQVLVDVYAAIAAARELTAVAASPTAFAITEATVPQPRTGEGSRLEA